MASSPSLRRRYRHILRFFAGVMARFVLNEIVLRRIGFGGRVRRTRGDRFRREAVRFRVLAIHMGGVMIKIGQFLSSRLDVLPQEVTDELAGLQDEVPAEDFGDIRALAEAELGAPLAELFARVEATPLAAASLGQVHRATLLEEHDAGFRDVVIKVQRPGIAAIVETDLAALRKVGAWLMRYRPVGKHADVPALLREFSATLHEEIDYRHEADNAERFHRDFAEDPHVRVPRVVRAMSGGQVLTLEDVGAIKITDYDAITAAGIARADVAARLLDCYLTQIFTNGFVHADPHPGNLFVTPLPSQDGEPVAWQLTFVDFGMMATVPDSVRTGLRELVVAVGTRDSDRLVRAYQMLGMILPGADLDVIAQVEAEVFARYWGRPMSELRQIDPQEVREFARQYRDLLLDLPFQVPRDLLYVARTAGILSGMCTGLDPAFNIWEQVRPYAMRLVQDEATTGVGRWLDEIADALLALLALPSQASRVLAKAERGGLPVRDEQAVRALRSLGRSVDRLSGAVVAAGLLVAASVLLGTGYVGASTAVFATSGVLLAALLLGGGRR